MIQNYAIYWRSRVMGIALVQGMVYKHGEIL